MNNYDLKIEFHKNCSKQILLIYSWNQSYLFHKMLYGWLLCLPWHWMVVDSTGDADTYLLDNQQPAIVRSICSFARSTRRLKNLVDVFMLWWCFLFFLAVNLVGLTAPQINTHWHSFSGLYYSVSMIVWFSLSYIPSFSLADLIIIYSSLLLKISESSQDETESDSTNISPTCW